METKDLTPIRDLILNTELSTKTYHELREAYYARENASAELAACAGEITGNPVREALVQDLQGNRDRAVQILAGAGDDPWACYWHGFLLLEDGRISQARDALEPAHSTHAGNSNIAGLLVEARALVGDPDAAKQLFDSLGIDGGDPMGAFLHGVICEKQGEYAEALNLYQRAVDLDGCPRFNFRLGYLASLHGSEEQALEAYEACVRTTPVYARAAINLGIMYEDLERYEDALHCYEMVLSAYPGHERVSLYHGDAMASLDMYYDREKEKEKTRRKQLLQIPVTDFELSVRSRNCLAKMNIHTLGDLIQKTEAELLSYKNFGETSLAEIKKILAQKGFRLGQGLEDKPRPSIPTDPEKSSLLAEPVSVLELSSRAQRCMDRLGIETLADLVKRTELELVNQRNFGVTSLNEVKRKLKDRALALASG